MGGLLSSSPLSSKHGFVYNVRKGENAFLIFYDVKNPRSCKLRMENKYVKWKTVKTWEKGEEFDVECNGESMYLHVDEPVNSYPHYQDRAFVTAY